MRVNKEIMYKNNKIRFLSDVPADIYKQQREYDSVRKKLRDRGILKHQGMVAQNT